MLLFSNQQLSDAVAESPMVAEIVMDDLEVFVRKSVQQATGVATDEAVRGVSRDLDGRIYVFNVNSHAKTKLKIKSYLPYG